MVFLKTLSINLHGDKFLKRYFFKKSNSTLNAFSVEHILKALVIKQEMRFTLYADGMNESYLIPSPVKVSFRKTEVSNEVSFLVMRMYRKLIF